MVKDQLITEHYRHQMRGRNRALYLFPDIPPCLKCGSKKSERHHKDGDTHNNNPSNIIPLCRKCHMLEDGRLNKFRGLGIKKAIRASADKKRAKTECHRGHLFTVDNTYITRRGMRVCKECRKIHKKNFYYKSKINTPWLKIKS